MKNRYIFLGLIILFSCKPNVKHEFEVIKVNPEASENVMLSDIASNVDYIALETNESCLITRIQNIELADQYIFINDAGRRILQFDTSGKFIRQIGREGRGPGEYSVIRGIAADIKNSILYVSCFSRKILSFDFNGELSNEINQEPSAEFITVVDENLWSVSTRMGIESEDNKYVNIASLTIYYPKNDNSDTLIIKKVGLTGMSGTSDPQAWHISDLGCSQFLYYPVLLSEPLIRDTLYEVKGDNLIPFLKLDFGLNDPSPEGSRQLLIRNIYRTNRYIFAEYVYNRNQNIFCYDITQSKNYNTDRSFTDNFFDMGIVQLRPLDLKNEKMYFVKDGFEIEGKIERMTENCNPVIFIVTLKSEG